MHRCYGCGQPLMSQYAHCHHYGCGWQNPAYRAEMAYERAVIAEEIREEIIMEEIVEDIFDGDFF